MTHTPTPWTVEPLIEALSTIDTSAEHVRANAAHIVHCVNTHAALVEALKLTKRNVESIIYMLPSIGNRIDRQSLETWRREVDNALALAEKGTPS